MTEKAEIPFAERLTCTVTEGCRATGLGRTGRRLIHVCSLIKYVNGDQRQADQRNAL
jgi:hypothetical protein